MTVQGKTSPRAPGACAKPAAPGRADHAVPLPADSDLKRFFQLSQELFALTDLDGRILALNPAWENIFGYALSELIGARYLAFLHPDDQAPLTQALQGLRAGGPAVNLTSRFRAKDGAWRILEIVSTPRDDLIFSAARDVTERKRTEAALEQSRQQLNEAARIAHLGTWEWNIAENAEIWSDEQYRIFGYAPQSFRPQYYTFLRSLHPEDRDRVLKAIEAALEDGKEYSVETRIVQPGGAVKHVLCQGQVFLNAAGVAVKLLGTVLDITERKQLENDLVAKNIQLAQQAEELRKFNSALSLLMEKREEDRSLLNDQMLANMRDLILPYLDKILQETSNIIVVKYIEIVKRNFQEITSPFTHTLHAQYQCMTPNEIRIADMIRTGTSSKAIAELLHISPRTVEFHRAGIRRKLGLSRKKINLQTYLNTLDRH